MIKFRDRIFEDYFIDPITAVVTDKNGKIKRVYFHHKRPIVIICGIRMPIHQIQAHTAYGYHPDLVIDHIDGNYLNNALSNLDYSMNQPEHMHKHHENKTVGFYGRTHNEDMKKHISESSKKNWDDEEFRSKVYEARRKSEKVAEALDKFKYCIKGTKWWNNGEISCRAKECPRRRVGARKNEI